MFRSSIITDIDSIDLETSSIDPSIGDSISLNKLLLLTNNDYLIESTIKGIDDNGNYITLEEFILINDLRSCYIPISIELEIYGNDIWNLIVEDLYVKKDLLFLKVISEESNCIVKDNEILPGYKHQIGLTDYPVYKVMSLKFDSSNSKWSLN